MDAWSLARELVRIDSSDPGAFEGEVERHLKELLSARVAALPLELSEQIELVEHEVFPERRNLMLSIPGRTDGPRLVLICHMDTVTLGDGWADVTPALSGVVRDERLYGRGACDMKGGLACAVSAVCTLLERMACTDELPQRGVALICTVDEEASMAGVEAAIASGWVGADEWVLDTEPTDGQIQVAHKGRTWFELTMNGVTAHASQPWEGADAVAASAEAISHIRTDVAALPRHEELGMSTVTFGMVQGGYQPYVVPDSCTTWIDMRLVPPANAALAERLVRDAIHAAEQAVPGCTGSYRITGDRPPIERDPSSPLLAELSATVERVAATPAKIGIFTGYTDTAVIAGTCGNRNCMSYGPGSLALAHKPNEYVPKVDIERVEAVLTELALSTT